MKKNTLNYETGEIIQSKNINDFQGIEVSYK